MHRLIAMIMEFPCVASYVHLHVCVS